jgi:hypothetical protein
MSYDDGNLPEGIGDDPADRSQELGSGMATRPAVDVVHGTVAVQSSDTGIDFFDIGSTYFPLQVKSWQETYDHVDQNSAETEIP